MQATRAATALWGHNHETPAGTARRAASRGKKRHSLPHFELTWGLHTSPTSPRKRSVAAIPLLSPSAHAAALHPAAANASGVASPIATLGNTKNWSYAHEGLYKKSQVPSSVGGHAPHPTTGGSARLPVATAHRWGRAARPCPKLAAARTPSGIGPGGAAVAASHTGGGDGNALCTLGAVTTGVGPAGRPATASSQRARGRHLGGCRGVCGRRRFMGFGDTHGASDHPLPPILAQGAAFRVDPRRRHGRAE